MEKTKFRFETILEERENKIKEAQDTFLYEQLKIAESLAHRLILDKNKLIHSYSKDVEIIMTDVDFSELEKEYHIEHCEERFVTLPGSFDSFLRTYVVTSKSDCNEQLPVCIQLISRIYPVKVFGDNFEFCRISLKEEKELEVFAGPLRSSKIPVLPIYNAKPLYQKTKKCDEDLINKYIQSIDLWKCDFTCRKPNGLSDYVDFEKLNNNVISNDDVTINNIFEKYINEQIQKFVDEYENNLCKNVIEYKKDILVLDGKVTISINIEESEDDIEFEVSSRVGYILGTFLKKSQKVLKIFVVITLKDNGFKKELKYYKIPSLVKDGITLCELFETLGEYNIE